MADAQPHGLEPGRNCWRLAKAERATVIVDADDYFRVVRAAMMKAKRQILLIGWDFDARIALVNDGEDHPEAPNKVGAFLSWLAEQNPDLSIHILRWDVAGLSTLRRGSTIFTVLKWKLHKRIHLKLDHHHPTGASHHQKIVVIDDCLAFAGGIDMTADRWDTRAHRDDEPDRIEPSGKPYGPWHDATTALMGPVAADLGELCRERWRSASGKAIPAPEPAKSCWPDQLPIGFSDVTVAISRSAPTMPDAEPVREIEALYLDLIARAKRHIYAESQYFASRKIAEAIAKRLQEPDGPEFVIVNPLSADGWLEAVAMDNARARLVQALSKRDPYRRLRIYHAVTEKRQPIYIHAKVTVIDDCVLRVGSSNFNNRSLRLDTECDVTIDASLPGNGDEEPTIAGVRNGLLGEHLGVAPEDVAAALAEKGSLIEAVERLRRDTGRSLIPYSVPDQNEVEKWLADNEIFDPEGPEETFEPLRKRGLLRRLRGRLSRG